MKHKGMEGKQETVQEMEDSVLRRMERHDCLLRGPRWVRTTDKLDTDKPLTLWKTRTASEVELEYPALLSNTTHKQMSS